KSITSGSARRRLIQDIIWPESHRCERIASAATSRCDRIPPSPSVRPHACGVILLLSLASPCTGGAHACHYRTAESDGCAGRRDSGVAVRRAGAAAGGIGRRAMPTDVVALALEPH